jgi:hypothetical protein
METTGLTKLQIIKSLGEKTTSLSLRKKDLIDKLFDVQIESEKQIKELSSTGLINIEDWGVSFLKRKYNSYLMYEGCVIDYYGGRYDGGDFNEFVPPCDYQKLLKFCENSNEIIKGMQDALAEELVRISKLTDK